MSSNDYRDGSYSYDRKSGHLTVRSDSGQSMDFYGKDAERMANSLGINLWKATTGIFKIASSIWDSLGRRSFR